MRLKQLNIYKPVGTLNKHVAVNIMRLIIKRCFSLFLNQYQSYLAKMIFIRITIKKG